MRPRLIGRALGIGVRVAGHIAGQQLGGPSRPVRSAPRAPAAPTASSVPPSRAAGQTAGQAVSQTGRSVSQGLGGLLRSFRRVGGIVWLEVTGVFFFLPVVVFAPTLWRASVAYPHTTDHKTFWVTAVIVVVFLYLGVSSFWRARRR